MSQPYFQRYARRLPAEVPAMSARRHALWHLLAGLTIGLAIWYLGWRWTQSLNPEAMVFSVIVVVAESLCLIGTFLFFYDIWQEDDTPWAPPPEQRAEVGLTGTGTISVDVLVTTYDEEEAVVAPSIAAAKAMIAPPGITFQVWLCDDGNRPSMRYLADEYGISYLARAENRGFKAGNLRNALFATNGDFIVICDADTRVLPGFLANTMGYFRDPGVAWVQTPHWFYDIPPGQKWGPWLARRLGRPAAKLAPMLTWITGRDRAGADPFMADPTMFFDVIQRRRNRNGASFCCGAGSIHRREALFQGALTVFSRELGSMTNRFAPKPKRRWWLPRQDRARQPGLPAPSLLLAVEMQPFRYHVSEDILTSIQLHSDTQNQWKSVYHPQVESRMLSACSVQAWSVQRLKYAGGTFDIMMRANPLFRRGMPWRIKLHYAATFWSYLSTVWMPVLLFAPAVALGFGISPVSSYSIAFFGHLIPVLIVNEIAMLVACKDHNIHQGRILSLASLPIQWRALISTLRGQRPRFPVTPKSLTAGGLKTYLWPNLVILAVLGLATVVGVLRYALGDPNVQLPLLITNLFWVLINALAVGWVLPAAFWRPVSSPSNAGVLPLNPPTLTPSLQENSNALTV